MLSKERIACTKFQRHTLFNYAWSRFSDNSLSTTGAAAACLKILIKSAVFGKDEWYSLAKRERNWYDMSVSFDRQN